MDLFVYTLLKISAESSCKLQHYDINFDITNYRKIKQAAELITVDCTSTVGNANPDQCFTLCKAINAQWND